MLFFCSFYTNFSIAQCHIRFQSDSFCDRKLIQQKDIANSLFRATDGTRTRDLHLGKVAYYQLYYYRITTTCNVFSERQTGLEPATSTLARWRTTNCTTIAHQVYFMFYVFVFIRTIFSISQLSHYVNIFFKFFEFFFLSENSNNLINARNNLYLTVPGILFFTYSASSFFSSFATTAIPSSSSCFSSTCPGASVIRSDASFTFGNAITSRMLSCFAISITRRSRP